MPIATEKMGSLVPQFLEPLWCCPLIRIQCKISLFRSLERDDLADISLNKQTISASTKINTEERISPPTSDDILFKTSKPTRLYSLNELRQKAEVLFSQVSRSKT